MTDETANEVRRLRRTIVGIVAAVVLAGVGYVALDAVRDDGAADGRGQVDCVNAAIAAGRSSDGC